MKNKGKENIASSDENLKTLFDSWDPKLKAPEVWNKLCESLEFEKGLTGLKKDFDDLGEVVPPSIWEKIESSLAERKTESLLQEDFNKWKTEPKELVWENIKQTTLLEKVWVDLSKDLSMFETKKSNRVLQFCLVFLILLLTFYTNDGLMEAKKKRSLNAINRAAPLNQTKIQEGIQSNSGTFKIAKNENEQDIRRNLTFANSEALTPRNNTPISDAKQTQILVENNIDEGDYSSVSQLNLLKFSVFSDTKALIIPLHLSLKNNRKDKKRFVYAGVDFFSTLNFIKTKKHETLSFTSGAVGYELGLFLSHPLKNLSQEYFLNYAVYRQNESGYKNGIYSQSVLTISGIKFSTLTKFSNKGKLSYGLGISSFFPLQSVKERNNKIVEMPKTDFLNLGFNVGIDYSAFSFSPRNKFILGIKYETVFPLNTTKSANKLYQNLNLGIKYKI